MVFRSGMSGTGQQRQRNAHIRTVVQTLKSMKAKPCDWGQRCIPSITSCNSEGNAINQEKQGYIKSI